MLLIRELTLGNLSKHDVDEARTSSENVTSRFCNHFSMIKLIMLEKCVLTILELNWNQRLGQEDKIEHLSSYTHVVHTCKTGHFTS